MIITLDNHINKPNAKNIDHNHINFLSLFLIHHKIIHIAIATDKAAWSDGKELCGKILCNTDSNLSASTHKVTFGLNLVKNNCKNTLNNIEKTQDQKIHKADSL
jgi:hypothetical protein